MTAATKLLRMTNAVLAPVAPGASGRVALHLFTTPRRHQPPAREALAERSGRRVSFGPGLSALRFGWGGGPRVLAMHGWEGRATQWGPLADALTAAGIELIAIDAPGHGHSPGRRANPRAFAEALLAADQHFGPFLGVVGHSMGGAATAVALSQGLRAERAVLIASPASATRVMHGFARFIGLPPVARERFFAHVQRHVGLPPQAFELPRLALELPTLVIHSRDDGTIDFRNAEQLSRAWPEAELLALDGLGHRRVMRSELSVRASVDFLTGFRAHTDDC